MRTFAVSTPPCSPIIRMARIRLSYDSCGLVSVSQSLKAAFSARRELSYLSADVLLGCFSELDVSRVKAMAHAHTFFDVGSASGNLRCHWVSREVSASNFAAKLARVVIAIGNGLLPLLPRRTTSSFS